MGKSPEEIRVMLNIPKMTAEEEAKAAADAAKVEAAHAALSARFTAAEAKAKESQRDLFASLEAS